MSITLKLTLAEAKILFDAANERAENIDSYAMTPAQKRGYRRTMDRLREAIRAEVKREASR